MDQTRNLNLLSDYYRVKISDEFGNSTKYFNITPAQLDAFVKTLDNGENNVH